jgi:hypothetical protein
MAIIVGLAASSAVCGRPPAGDLIFLTRDGCATSARMLVNLDAAVRLLGRPVAYQVVDQATLSSTDPRTGYPTPTLLYANRDVFGMRELKPPFPEPT